MTKLSIQDRVQSTEDEIIDVYGRDPGPLVLVRTAFHGGGEISRHRTISGAAKALVRYQGDTDCICGCAKIIKESDVDGLPEAGQAESPYSAAAKDS